jgi:hypothetical protein
MWISGNTWERKIKGTWNLEMLVGYTGLETEQMLTREIYLRSTVQLDGLLYRMSGGRGESVYVDRIVKDNWTKITLIFVLTKREVKDKKVK